MNKHYLTWGDQGNGVSWQALCCGNSAIVSRGSYSTSEQAKSAVRIICEGKKEKNEQI